MTNAYDDRAAALVLAVMDGDATADCLDGLDAEGRAAVEGYRRLFHADFPRAVEVVGAAGGSPYAGAVRRQVEALCTASISGGLDVAGLDPTTPAGAMAIFHTSEAAHVVGAIPECSRMVSEALAAGVPHRRARTWLRMARVRSLLFQGEVGRAEDQLLLVAQDAESPLALQSVRCLQAMAAGLRGNKAEVVLIAEDLRSRIVAPSTYADAGLALLGAFGLASCGFPAAAAELLLYGAGGPGLPLLPMTLRAYGYDLLIEAATAAGNLELAGWILAEFDRLDLAGIPQMLAAREASRARVQIAQGELATGMVRAHAAAQQAVAASSELVGTRAALTLARAGAGVTGEASGALVRRLVAEVGSEDLRAWMDRALAESGRAPRPLPGLGWDQLSATQQVVARLAARGLRNQEIADLLVVSPRTVEAHVGAILDVLGVSNRVGIVAAADARRSVDPAALATMTARQRQVAMELVDGRTNAEIAARLGIGQKAVEKHVSGLLRGLGVGSRAAVVARILR